MGNVMCCQNNTLTHSGSTSQIAPKVRSPSTMRQQSSKKVKQMRRFDAVVMKKTLSQEDSCGESSTKHRLTYNDIDLDVKDITLVLKLDSKTVSNRTMQYRRDARSLSASKRQLQQDLARGGGSAAQNQRKKTKSSVRGSRDATAEPEARSIFGLCATGGSHEQSTTNSTVVVRPQQVTKKVLKPKQLLMNTSMSTLPTAQQATQFEYLVQTSNAATDPIDVHPIDQEQYRSQHLAFELKHELPQIDFLNFSQRRFVGFRNRYEFEKKRLVVASKKCFSVLGYDHRKHVYELVRHEVADKENEEFRYVNFLEDSQPQYLIILTANKLTRKTSLQIMQVKKDDIVREESEHIYKAIETDNQQLTRMIKDNFKKGNFKKYRKKSLDNYELLPNMNALALKKRQQDAAQANQLRQGGTVLAAQMKMSGKRQDITKEVAGTDHYQTNQLLKPQIEPIMEESVSIDNKTDGLHSSSNHQQKRPEGDDNFTPESTDSDEELAASQQEDGAGIKVLADQIGQLESRLTQQQDDTGSVPSQLDTSSLILNRIKLWPPRDSSLSTSQNDLSASLHSQSMMQQQSDSSMISSSIRSPGLPSFGGKSMSEQVPPNEAILSKEDPTWFNKVYPFKAEEFGQLHLQENVIKAKLVSLNNYGAVIPAALLSARAKHSPSESQITGTYILFTVEENDYLTLYKIKSYLMQPLSTVIQNFKMAKKSSLLLEYPAQNIEWITSDSAAKSQHLPMSHNSAESYRRSKQLIQPNFLITYVDQPFIDYFDEKGSLMHRVDVAAIFEAYEGLELGKLGMVKLPKLVWSCRSLGLIPNGIQVGETIHLKEKLIICGQCTYKGSERPFLARLSLTFSIPNVETPRREKIKQEVKVDAEVIKIIGGEEFDQITALEFGPYDNGYILAGMQSGRLLVYDSVTLDRIKEFMIFTKGQMQGELKEAEAIGQITLEPTELVFVAGVHGSIAALSIIKKEMNYVYLDLGNREYCTVAIPRGEEEGNLDNEGFDHSPLKTLFEQNKTGSGGAICCI